jgi:hypothetical protein
MFSLSELKAATENFSDKNKIGGGAFGDVYKVLRSVTWFVNSVGLCTSPYNHAAGITS